jgi:CubicO group peptidase (beta-lactamase class C family)
MRSLAVIVGFLFSFSLFAQQVDTKAVDRVMNGMLKAWSVPGAAVAVVKNDRVVHVSGYGMKEMGGTEPVTADTLFQLASTSKAFTTTALAMLADEKKLSFDDPVAKHVPYFHLKDMCADSQVTIRDIVSHRTGAARRDELWDNTPLTREEVIRAMSKIDMARGFRSGYGYHNIMYIAAGEVIASASGTSWDEFVKTRIFQPLNMNRTVTSDEAWNASTDRATGYRHDSKTNRIWPQPPIETHTLGAGGAIKSSARDMGNWLRFHLANGAFELRQLVSAAMLEETKQPNTPIRIESGTRDSHPETNVMSYAMGWVVQDYRGEQVISHSGALNGFRAQVVLLPRRGLGFVILSNLGRGTALVAARYSLIDALSGKHGRDWNAYYQMIEMKELAKAEKEKEERLAKRIPNTTPTHSLDKYTGEYESAAYGVAKIINIEGRLVFQWARMSIPLTHVHYDVFHAESEIDWVEEEVTFELTPEREIRALKIFGETFRRR